MCRFLSCRIKVLKFCLYITGLAICTKNNVSLRCENETNSSRKPLLEVMNALGSLKRIAHPNIILCISPNYQISFDTLIPIGNCDRRRRREGSTGSRLCSENIQVM